MVGIKSKAQALLELAIIGPVVLVALGLLVTYICKLNNDQYALMQAFRYALATSHTTNKAVGFGTWDDRRMASVTDPIIGDKVTSSGAGYAYWTIPAVSGDPEGSIWVKINRLPPIDVTQAQSGAIAPRYFTYTHKKVESENINGTITSSREGGAVEIMLYKVGSDKEGITIPYGRAHFRKR